MKEDVSELGEKKLVSYILSKNSSITPDDGAIIDLGGDLKLVSTTDMLIQSKHFPKNMTYFQMGLKAVTANVSDLAAMGAKPLGFLLSIAVPKDLNVSDFDEIISGVMSACKLYEIPLIGGDTNEAGEIIINGTALGTTKKPMMKNTYKKGDLIAITGKVGLAGLGFYSNSYENYLLKPLAKVKEGLILSENGASSVTDITDGLGSELHEMFNGNGMLIYEDQLNISDEFKKIANELNLNYLDLVLYFGEDFELLFTIPKNKVDSLKKKIDIMVIGEVTDSEDINIVLENGDIEKIRNKGYDHFA